MFVEIISWKTCIIILFIILLLILLRKYLNGPMCNIKMNLHGKTILVTGSSSGIGLEIATNLAQDGATVIFATRNRDKTQKVVTQKFSDNNMAIYLKNCVYYELDLSSYDSISNFANIVKLHFPNKIDILINNGGALEGKFRRTQEGIEKTVGVNYIGHLILTILFLNYMNVNSRIINVVSWGYAFAKVNFDQMERDLNFNQLENNYSCFNQYAISKLGLVTFSEYLVDYIDRHSLQIKCVMIHPGCVHTDAQSKIDIWYIQLLYKIFYPIVMYLFKDPLHGAQTAIHCAKINYEELVNGGYYQDLKLTTLTSYAKDKDTIRRNISYTIKLISDRIPQISCMVNDFFSGYEELYN
jgi:retinol dehydrogenase-12